MNVLPDMYWQYSKVQHDIRQSNTTCGGCLVSMPSCQVLCSGTARHIFMVLLLRSPFTDFLWTLVTFLPTTNPFLCSYSSGVLHSVHAAVDYACLFCFQLFSLVISNQSSNLSLCLRGVFFRSIQPSLTIFSVVFNCLMMVWRDSVKLMMMLSAGWRTWQWQQHSPNENVASCDTTHVPAISSVFLSVSSTMLFLLVQVPLLWLLPYLVCVLSRLWFCHFSIINSC